MMPAMIMARSLGGLPVLFSKRGTNLLLTRAYRMDGQFLPGFQIKARTSGYPCNPVIRGSIRLSS
jgi:hypothetical protein